VDTEPKSDVDWTHFNIIDTVNFTIITDSESSTSLTSPRRPFIALFDAE
jgi:hypothetical protein